MLRQLTTTVTIQSNGRGLHEITEDVLGWVPTGGIREGLLTLFLRYTSASFLIQENADPEVQAKVERLFGRLAPDGGPLFHTATKTLTTCRLTCAPRQPPCSCRFP